MRIGELSSTARRSSSPAQPINQRFPKRSVDNKPYSNMKGFTLLELLVVLALIGLLAGIAAPNLEKMVTSIEKATQRNSAFAEIQSLNYRAYTLGQPFILTEEKTTKLLADGNPILTLPTGWKIQIPKPIQFNFNGYCNGGPLQLTAPDGEVIELELSPVTGRLKERNAAK
jgi:general secretion pathway protein H